MDYIPAGVFQRQLARLSRQDLSDRLSAIRALSAVRGLRYLDDNSRPRTIMLASAPWLLTRQQMAFFGTVAQQLIGGLLRLPALYARHRAIREILPFDPAQRSWLRLAAHPRHGPLAVMGRLDSTATFSHRAWRREFQMLEANAVGVGGVHYAPAGCSILLDVFGDLLERTAPGRRVVPTPDPRQLLLEELAGTARRLGRRLRGIALLENTDYTTGTDEFSSLAAHFNRVGLTAVVADPRDLRYARGRLLARGTAVDLLYRDSELSEFIEMEGGGHRLAALRQAIREGRLISGLLWEYDLKSAWDVFTDPAWGRHFTPGQRALFRAHLPWTRLVRDARVSDPAGRSMELLPYIRRHKDQLVLKPNTLYGGQGVTIGVRATQAQWERKLAQALRGPIRYVVQRRAQIRSERFPAWDDGRLRDVERRVVSGFFVTSTGVGLVGRFSEDPVVNVSRGGGLLSALLVQ